MNYLPSVHSEPDPAKRSAIALRLPPDKLPGLLNVFDEPVAYIRVIVARRLPQEKLYMPDPSQEPNESIRKFIKKGMQQPLDVIPIDTEEEEEEEEEQKQVAPHWSMFSPLPPIFGQPGTPPICRKSDGNFFGLSNEYISGLVRAFFIVRLFRKRD